MSDTDVEAKSPIEAWKFSTGHAEDSERDKIEALFMNGSQSVREYVARAEELSKASG